MEPKAPDSSLLIKRARNGDHAAYADLFSHYRDLAIGTAFVILGDRSDAEDAVQEAFARAFTGVAQLRSDSAFRPWLLSIVANEARTLRAASLRRTELLERAGHQLSTVKPTPSAEAAALAVDRRNIVLRALFELSERDRLLVTYRYFFDLSEDDMAQALGVPRGTIKSGLSRALARLKPILARLGPFALVPPWLAQPRALRPKQTTVAVTIATLALGAMVLGTAWRRLRSARHHPLRRRFRRGPRRHPSRKSRARRLFMAAT